MSSVLEALKTHWGAKEVLKAIVPAARVQLGPLNPGSHDTPAVGLMSETIGRGFRASGHRYPQITVGVEVQAADLDTLERLHEAMQDNLDGLSADRYRVLQLADVQMTISRPEDSPSRLWHASVTLTFDAQALN